METGRASGALYEPSTTHEQDFLCEVHEQVLHLYYEEDDLLSSLDPNLMLHVLTYVDPVDLASLEATSSVFQKPANLDRDKRLSLPELAGWAMCEVRDVFKQMKDAEKQILKRQCGGSWKLVLRFLKARESLQQETFHVFPGSCHSVVTTRAGAVYSFGANRSGQLGHPLQTETWKPRLISSLYGVRVIQAAVGFERTMLLTDMGKVYAFGRNSFSDQPESENSPSRPIFTPELVTSLYDVFVVQIAIGFFFTAVLSREGKVYTFSWGSKDKLGHATDSNDMEPRLLGGNLTDIPVLQIGAGHCYLLALAYQPNGMSIYAVGCGRGGKLGNGSEIMSAEPEKINHFQQINFKPIAIAAGGWHGVALSDDGRVCTWGWGCSGCLGHGRYQNTQTLPMVVDALAGVNVIRIGAGFDTTYVYADNGDAYCCGNLTFLNNKKVSFLPRLITTFRDRGEHVVQISKTNDIHRIHGLALTLSGRVYACGDGSKGQLGIQLPDNVDVMDWSLIPQLNVHACIADKE